MDHKRFEKILLDLIYAENGPEVIPLCEELRIERTDLILRADEADALRAERDEALEALERVGVFVDSEVARIPTVMRGCNEALIYEHIRLLMEPRRDEVPGKGG